ncbi:MAG: hypothetical protein KME38_25480 [Spirirestis rafaelensis WJT71-NPBG6]|nr:hypothetical protein [Spirirestis rafaelensis WJT71-NPBG6]
MRSLIMRGIVRRAATVEERHTWVMLAHGVILSYARVAADTAVLRLPCDRTCAGAGAPSHCCARLAPESDRSPFNG